MLKLRASLLHSAIWEFPVSCTFSVSPSDDDCPDNVAGARCVTHSTVIENCGGRRIDRLQLEFVPDEASMRFCEAIRPACHPHQGAFLCNVSQVGVEYWEGQHKRVSVRLCVECQIARARAVNVAYHLRCSLDSVPEATRISDIDEHSSIAIDAEDIQ